MQTLQQVKAQIAAYPAASILGTKKEVRNLPKILKSDEKILAVTSGIMESQTWLAVCTDQRLFFFNCRFLFGQRLVQLALKRVQTIDDEQGMVLGSIRVWDGANEFTLQNVVKSSITPFVNITVKAIAQANEDEEPQANTPVSTPTPSTDVASQLERLAALKEKGHLTAEEFDAQKKKLLA